MRVVVEKTEGAARKFHLPHKGGKGGSQPANQFPAITDKSLMTITTRRPTIRITGIFQKTRVGRRRQRSPLINNGGELDGTAMTSPSGAAA
jgi:hypothetical protein